MPPAERTNPRKRQKGTPGKGGPAVFALINPRPPLGSLTTLIGLKAKPPRSTRGALHCRSVTEPARRLGLGYPPGRDPLRTIHTTIQLPTAPPKQDISTLLALGHFYFALTDDRPGLSRQYENVLIEQSRNVLLTGWTLE